MKWYTDNKGVAAIIKSGSSKVHLHKLAMEIFSLSKEHNVIIDIEWIPRSENVVANYLSKIVDFDDWSVKDSYFRAVDSIWGPFTVDWVKTIPSVLYGVVDLFGQAEEVTITGMYKCTTL